MSVKPVMGLATEAIGEESGGTPVKGLVFYPAERAQEIIDRLKAARGTEREAAELRIFAERVNWLYEQSEETYTWLDIEETARLAAIGEAVEDAARTEKLEAPQ